MHADTLIHARWVIPVEPAETVLEAHAVAIEHGRIKAILPSFDADRQISAGEVVRLEQHALIPGLVNAHTHSAMSLFRGLADDLPLMDWLNNYIWPAEQQWVHEEFVAEGSRLAIAEMLRSGTTCFNDMYFFPDVTGRVAAQAKIRAAIGLILIDFPSTWAESSEDYFSKALEVHEHFLGDPLVHTLFAPHAPYSVGDAPLARLRTLADELDLPVHMHVHETRDEVQGSLQQHGLRPLERLERLGLLNPNLVAVHMTQLEAAEIQRVAAAGCHVVHCPESNLKLASGFCPVSQLMENGVNLALGTDGAASNNDLNMLGEMRSAALLAKGISGNAATLSAFNALKMATLNGARALGFGDETGSLLPGKAADITAIRLDRPETLPVYNPVSQIVYAASREQVSDVWVNGEQLLQDRELTTLDIDEIYRQADHWQALIASGSRA